MSLYQLLNDNIIIRKSDNAHIPTDDNNVDYQDYKKFLSDGNVPDKAILDNVNENNLTLSKIDALEQKQHRAIREFLLGDDTAKIKIKDIDAQINEFRNLLK